VTYSCDTSAVLKLVLLAKDRQKALHHFPISKLFLRFFLCKISCSNVWLDRTFQISAQTLFILHSFYKFHVSFTFDNKLQKRNISKLMSVCLSARPSIIVSEKTTRLPTRDFMERNFRRSAKKILRLIKSDTKLRIFYLKPTYICYNV
jgi:hypothetical protein